MSTTAKVESLDALRRFQEALGTAEQQLEPTVARILASVETRREWISAQLHEATNRADRATEALHAAQASYENASTSLNAAHEALSDATNALDEAETNLGK